jgi:hypothetical protein
MFTVQEEQTVVNRPKCGVLRSVQRLAARRQRPSSPPRWRLTVIGSTTNHSQKAGTLIVVVDRLFAQFSSFLSLIPWDIGRLVTAHSLLLCTPRVEGFCTTKAAHTHRLP